MSISRSGYYKWLKNKDSKNIYHVNRDILTDLVKEIHQQKPSYGYHRIHAKILETTGWLISANLVHKVCKYANIKSKAKHYKYSPKQVGKESIKYPNLINNNWKTTRPFEKLTTDSTKILFKHKGYDWTYYLDTFNGEIVGSDIRDYSYGASMKNHLAALNDMLENKKTRGYIGQETILHSDQGTIYSSLAFNNAHKEYDIIRSMSRAGTPTDNPVIESKNGWLKQEICMDFNQNDFETVEDYINAIIYDNNHYRPSFALNYKTPVQYRTELGFQ